MLKNNQPITVAYDTEADAAYIYLTPENEAAKVVMTYPCNPVETKAEINLDFNAEGQLIGVEVLDASKKLKEYLIKPTT